MEDPVIERARQIIDQTGETQQVIAERIGIDPTKLTKSLSGKRRFTSLELALLAQLGGRTVDWLLTGRASRSWSFAHRLSTLAPEAANEAGELAVQALAEYHEALEALGYLTKPAPALPSLSTPMSFVKSGKDLAAWALGRMPNPMRGASNAALIADIEAAFGVDVIISAIPDGCDGMSYADGDLRVIVLASTDRAARQRYTLAHELGHILAGDANQEVIRERVGTGRTIEERRADVFAASFLAPTAEVRAALSESPDSGSALAWELGISPESLSWRLFNLKLVDEYKRARLASQTSREVAARLGKTTEQLDRDRISQMDRPPMRVLSGYLRAFLDGQATLHAVASLLNLDVETTYDIFASPIAESPVGNPELIDD